VASRRVPDLRIERPRARSDEWLHQVKHDGWRVLVGIDESGELTVSTRNGHDYTGEFELPVKGLAALGRPMILDGEIAVPNKTGLTHLDWLHDARTRRRPDLLAFIAFDLLYLDGFDLRRCPIEERLALLDQLVRDAGCPRVVVAGYEIGQGSELFAAAKRPGAEEIVSKRLGRPYLAGESRDWLKIKVTETGRFVVTGYETEVGELKAFHVAAEREDDLHPQGRVKFPPGLRGLLPRLREIHARYPGYRARDGVIPVKPGLRVDVKYFGRIARENGKIPGGALRDAVLEWWEFEDPAAVPSRAPKAAIAWWSCDTPDAIAAMDVMGDHEPARQEPATTPKRSRAPQPAAVESKIVVEPVATPAVPAQNIQRVLEDAAVPSRDELVAHWQAVADLALEYLARRPLTLVRHVESLTFFHEGALPSLASGVQQMTYRKRNKGEIGYRVWIEDLAGLLGLVEMGAVELHPWGSAIDDIDHPDTLVLDLDPDPNIKWGFVTETALRLRDIFEEKGLPTWPKLSGGKGIHVVAPVEPTLTWEEGRAFVRSIAERLAATAPDRYTVLSSLAQRPGRIFLDYTRNGLGATYVGWYSPRPRRGFPVAMPVTWDDIERGMRPDAFRLTGAAAGKASKVRRRPTQARTAV
jgi:bifunctional non-homologous end joining protein LigD